MAFVQQWGRSVTVTRRAGSTAVGEPSGSLDLISIPGPPGRPVVWILDLEILDVATGQPPGTPSYGGAFLVSYGAGGDAREHVFPAGIHCVVAQAVRVRVTPHSAPLSGAPLTYRYSAHATWTLAVPPSYSWIR